MRKVKMQQKNGDGEQLKMFNHRGEPAITSDSGTVGYNTTGDELTSRLEQQRALTYNLIEKVVEYGNIKKAYQQVKANKGSSGIDGMSVDELRIWLGQHLHEIQQQLLTGQYEVGAVRKVEIPKPNGGKRMLGIPTVKDRLIQQSMHRN